MFKKRIKALIMSCVLVCILPVMSYAMDKDEFLKFLVNSSYPESKAEDTQKSEKKEEVNTNNDKKDKEYIKFHIGEENIPTINNEANADTKKSSEESTTVSNSSYENNVRVTKENPKILLYHSHAGETYSNAPAGNYHSKDADNSILAVGKIVTEELNKKGWGVVHSTKYHDYPDFTESYGSSYKTLQELLPKYKNVDIAVDLHRDARDLKTEAEKKSEHERMTTTINGEKVAKFFFVVGARNSNVNEIKALAQDITKFAQAKYPELVKPIIVKPKGRYNQSVVKNHMLIEVGSNGTTADEAKASGKYVAQILDEYFKSKN